VGIVKSQAVRFQQIVDICIGNAVAKLEAALVDELSTGREAGTWCEFSTTKKMPQHADNMLQSPGRTQEEHQHCFMNKSQTTLHLVSDGRRNEQQPVASVERLERSRSCPMAQKLSIML